MAIRSLREQDAINLLSVDENEAAVQRGKSLFLATDLSGATISYQTLEMLHWLTRFRLSPEEVARTRSTILARNDDWTGQPFEEVWAKCWMLYRLKVDAPPRIAELRRWVSAGGKPDQIPPMELQHDMVRQCFEELHLINGPFSVEWNGFVTASQSGAHVFSISPINVNSSNPDQPIKFAMTISVGGQKKLDSSPTEESSSGVAGGGAWTSSSSPVQLVAGRPVAFRVTATANVAEVPDSILHAIVSWSRDGGPQVVLPSSSLTLPTTGEPGLAATYSWQADGQPRVLKRVDANIDFAWVHSPIKLAVNTATASKLSDVMWATLTSPAYLQSLLDSQFKMHPFFKEPDDTSCGLSTERRKAFHELLLQTPQLLDTVSVKLAVDFYQAHRAGAPETALDVFGVWAQRHADLMCKFGDGSEFDADTRSQLAGMAMLTTLQLPHHAARLQNEYLQLPDGRCSLPVAYALASSYLGRQKLEEWTAFLDTRLSDSSLVGDTRVNWLIARAYAEEIRYMPQNLDLSWNTYRSTRALDGQVYLEQALKAAKSPATISRATLEIAARLVWGGQTQAAQDLLTKTSKSLPVEEQAKLSVAIAQVIRLTNLRSESALNQSLEAQKAYLSVLKQRRDLAAAKGDTATAQRYEELISKASQSSR
ncbi:PA14 domain-containing protein [Schlesneria paludicola]|uniref:PA14 domain-containing protein n=1 Tax=Schlesneria paludicola TaxID=360056 RepID=UPI000492D1A6|nr:PA14 domain-containing protein [Schlesneria paludicola]